MIYILIFIIELILLFFISKKLINSLAQTFFRFTKSHKIVVNILAVLFLPGTIIHELSHLLTAGMMFVPVGEINVLPEIEEKGIRLGSVQIGKTDPIRIMFIGFAPVLLGFLLILLILYLLRIQENILWWHIALSLYLVFEIGNTMFSSKKDLEGTTTFLAAILVVGIIVFGGLYFLNQQVFQNILNFILKINYDPAISFFKMACLYLLVPLGLDILIILATVPFNRQE